jgi:RecA-family ATPase
MTIRALSIRGTLEAAPPVLDFVLPGLLPSTVGTIVGPGGIGKTTFLLQLAMSVAAALPVAGGVFPAAKAPCRAVILAAEESATLLQLRLHAIAGKSTRGASALATKHLGREETIALWEKNLSIIPAAGEDVYLVQNGERTAYLASLCDFCKGARLIIVDPLRRLHDGDENNSGAMTHVVQTLELLAHSTGAAVIAVHHVSKGALAGSEPENAGVSRGSIALTDAVRWQINLSDMSASDAKRFRVTGDEGHYLRLDFAKTNYLPRQLPIWMKRLENGVLERENFGGEALTKALPTGRSRGTDRASRGSSV